MTQSLQSIDPVSISPEMDEAICATNPWYWAYHKHINLVPGPFSLDGHEFQVRPMSIRPPVKVFAKATQVLVTESEVLNVLNGMIYGYYPTGVYYLFPNKEKVSEFSKSRFKPLIQDNPETIGQFVRDTDSVNLKRIGRGFLYFRSGRLGQDIEGQMKTSAALKGDPADHAVHDEYDEMHPGIDEFVEGRLAKSAVQTKVYLANPTIPNYGIDKKFYLSDQEYWHVKCQHCGKYTCLDDGDSFPKQFHELSNGSVIRACSNPRCERDLDVRFGEWVAKQPLIKDIIGFTFGHPSAHWVDPGKLLRKYNDPNTDRSNFIRLQLGKAHIAAEDELTWQQVFACCGHDGMASESKIENSYGLDVGKELHMVIGHPTSLTTRKIIKVVRLSNFNDVHDLAIKFNCKCGVIDIEPETHKVREFQRVEPYKVILCDYAERQKVSEKIDEEHDILVTRRTELFDRTHNLISEMLITLPRKSPELEQYALEMCNAVKVLKEDNLTQSKRYIYIKRGPEHYRNATNYFELACDHVQVARKGPVIRHKPKGIDVLARLRGNN